MISYWRKKYVQLDTHGFWLCLVLASAITIRILLIAFGWPTTNSDEGTMGLMAINLAFHGQPPIFFYGQSYMGALEAYLASPLFLLLGPSTFTLRFGLVLLFTAFLLALYLLTRLLYTKEYALLCITLLCFGSIEMFTRQLKAVGGAVETMLFGCLILLFTTYLVLPQQEENTVSTRRRRYLLYGLLGLAMGLGIWSHMLILPFVAVSCLLLLLFCRAELKTRATLFLLAGLFIGLLPSIIYSIENPLQNFIFTLVQLHSTGGTAVSQPYTPWDDLLGTVLISVPMATGAPHICTVSTTPGQWREQISSCMIPQGLWGAGYVLLFLLACVLVVKHFLAFRRSTPAPRSLEDQRTFILHTMRLMVMLTAVLTFLAYVPTPAPALVPVTSTRYLVGLLVAFPVILAPLWGPFNSKTSGRTNNALRLRRVVFLGIGLLLAVATWGVFQQVPSAQAVKQQQQTFIADLERIHADHIYSDYWTCDNVMFLSDTHIICGVLGNDLQPGQNRYQPYLTMVQSDPQAAYVFTVGSPQAALLAQKLKPGQYNILTLDGYVVYQPKR
jgi:4-amino-4-deoxy-L-arabinose transferase-like glycosyltransferase